MSNTTGLGELGERPRGSGRRGHDGEGRTEQDEGRSGGEGHSEEQERGQMRAGCGHGGGEESSVGPRRVVGGSDLD